MCSYKVVHASFEVWGFQTRVEDFIQKCIRDILLLGHRQAFTWIDEWYDMTMEDVRNYERQTQSETNRKVLASNLTNQQQQQLDGGDDDAAEFVDASDEPNKLDDKSGENLIKI